MIPRTSIFDVVAMYYLPDDPLTELSRLIGWPIPIETDSVEIQDGGGA
jgi:hypothetical protein